MNLVGTLGKMILNNAMKGGGGNVLGGLLGGAAKQGGGAGGLGDLLGSLTKAGGAEGQAGGAGGLGDLLGKATQGGGGGLGDLLGKASQGGGGGLGDLLGKLQQQGGQQLDQNAPQGGGNIGDLLGGLLGGGAGGQAGGLGDLLGSALGQQMPGGAVQAPAPTQQQTDQAGLLITAMISAAKADGNVDAEEQEKIVGQLGEIEPDEAAFIRSEMQKPLDLAGLVKSVPRGMEQQVYVLSLMSINLDSKAEADYLDQLAKGLKISNEVSNQLHTELGSPLLYA